MPASERERVEFKNGDLRLVADHWLPVEAPRAGGAVLLHGGGQTRHSWRNAGDRLAARGWETWSLDARGHGESDWAPDGDYRLDAMVADLKAVLAALPEPPVLIGASMGGLTALIAEGEDPGLARALVLVDVTPRIEQAGVDKIANFMRSGMNGFATLEEAADAVQAYNPLRRRPSNPEGLKKNLRLRNGRWYWHWDPAFIAGMPDDSKRDMLDPERHERAAAALTLPVLLVRGKESDVVSEDGAANLLRLVPHAEYVDVSGAGHMVAGDDNDVFSVAVLDFLSRLPARTS